MKSSIDFIGDVHGNFDELIYRANDEDCEAAGGCLACYRFDGEQQLDATKLEWVNALLSVATEIAPEESVNAASC